MRLRAIDFCCGAGGWAVAARGLPIDIVCAVDCWRRACLTYRLNHPDTLVVRCDARKIPVTTEGWDLILGGIPCQWLTQLRSAGLGNKVKEEELKRERELLDSVLAFCREAKPRYWCLEDVQQIVKELPPFTPYHILDAQFWSGQRRVRCYVGDFPRPVPPLEGDPRLAGEYLRPGPHRVHPKNLKRTVARRRVYQNADVVYPIERDRKWPTVVSGGSRQDKHAIVYDKPTVREGEKFPTVCGSQKHDDQHLVVGGGLIRRGLDVEDGAKFPTVMSLANGFWRDEVTAPQKRCQAKVQKGKKWPTVAGASRERSGALLEGERRRQIEWQEAATAQGFPEDYLFVGSQTDVSQMVANAVQIDMARAILISICEDAGLL